LDKNKMQKFDVVVVGAGFAGMYALHKLRELGFTVKVVEAGDGVGGTWFWNRYPGARCDVNSLEYSYQFSEELQQEWSWSEKYAPQPEIVEYANHVADRFDLRRDIQFTTRVISMVLQESSRWILTTHSEEKFEAQFCVMATGCLSKFNIPKFEGMENYAGEVLHTGDWPKHEVDFEGKDVGIIGTGSSAIQAIPIIAGKAKSLTVFQRTASYSIPAHNAATNKEYEESVKTNYAEFRRSNSQRYAALNNNPNPVSALELESDERRAYYQSRWNEGGLSFLASFNDIGSNLEANKTAATFVHSKIHEIVKDQAVAELLCPKTVLGCKRLCVDTNYYGTFNRDNVTLVDIAEVGIDKISERGVIARGEEFSFDTLIFATGFDAMTGALLDIDIRGSNGLSLKEKWQGGPKNYLGLTISGFPNLFTITGPGSPSVLANMIVAIEQHVEWIASCLSYLRDNSKQRIEAEVTAEGSWVELVNDITETTIYSSGCNSWYTGANIPGKPRIFMPYLGYPSYVEKCESVVKQGYSGFKIS
jgi:cation diffusion facilitator CzcD-associated flavoprotein CzcO